MKLDVLSMIHKDNWSSYEFLQKIVRGKCRAQFCQNL